MTTPSNPAEMSIDDAVEQIILQNTDHAAFLRQLVKDNILVSRTAKMLTEEYSRIRTELVDIARVGTGPMVFAIRRVIAGSEKRMSHYFMPEPQVLQPNQPTVLAKS